MFTKIVKDYHWSNRCDESVNLILLRNECINLNEFLSSNHYNGRPIAIKQYYSTGIGVNTIVFSIEPDGSSIPVADITDYESW